MPGSCQPFGVRQWLQTSSQLRTGDVNNIYETSYSRLSEQDLQKNVLALNPAAGWVKGGGQEL